MIYFKNMRLSTQPVPLPFYVTPLPSCLLLLPILPFNLYLPIASLPDSFCPPFSIYLSRPSLPVNFCSFLFTFSSFPSYFLCPSFSCVHLFSFVLSKYLLSFSFMHSLARGSVTLLFILPILHLPF